MRTLRNTFVALTTMLLLVSCSDEGSAIPTENEAMSVNSLETVPADQCSHNLALFRGGAPAAQVTDAPAGTYYQCLAGEVHQAVVGQTLYEEQWIKNVEGVSYTVRLYGPYEFVLANPTVVTITNPLEADVLNENGSWVSLTETCTLFTGRIRVHENGSGLLTTDEKVDTRSGEGQNE